MPETPDFDRIALRLLRQLSSYDPAHPTGSVTTIIDFKHPDLAIHLAS